MSIDRTNPEPQKHSLKIGMTGREADFSVEETGYPPDKRIEEIAADVIKIDTPTEKEIPLPKEK